MNLCVIFYLVKELCSPAVLGETPKVIVHLTDEVCHLTFTGNVSKLTWTCVFQFKTTLTSLPKMDSPPNSEGDSSVPHVTIMSQDELDMLDKKVSKVSFLRIFQ